MGPWTHVDFHPCSIEPWHRLKEEHNMLWSLSVHICHFMYLFSPFTSHFSQFLADLYDNIVHFTSLHWIY